MKLKKKLIAATSAIALSVAASSANAGPTYDFAMTLKGQNQVNYVQAIIKNYTRTIPIYRNLVTRYGHYSWAQSFVKRYNDMIAEVDLLQSILDNRAEEIPTEVGKETVWGAEFDVTQTGQERLVETRVREVEEQTDLTVRVYEEVTEMFERTDTVRHYRGRVIYTIYSNGERVPLVTPLLMSTNTQTETREATERRFLREYDVVVEETAPVSEFGAPTANVLTADEYRERDDVMLAGTDTYRNAAWARNSGINQEYIDEDRGLAMYANSLDYIGAPEAWSRGWTGAGSRLAILDTGIDMDHAEFANRIAATECFTGMCNDERLIADGSNETIQDGNRYSHGTHVAGIAAAALDGVGTTGVAPDAELLIGKVAFDNGYYDLSKLGEAISWAVNNGADAINVSGNYNTDITYRRSIESMGDGFFVANDDRYDFRTLGFSHMMNDNIGYNIADAMANNESVLVMSAGNQRMQTPTFPAHWAIAENDNGELLLDGRAIVVGNWDVRTNSLASSSNAAGTMCFEFEADGSCATDRKISDWYILAPGQWVAAPDKDGGYVVNSGTSMAAPVVTGAVGVIHQMWPHMTGQNIVQLLLNTADDTIAGYDENLHGQGLLDLDEATRPQGVIGIPTTGRIDGAVSSVGGVQQMRIAGAQISALEQMMVVDEYDRDFYMDGNAVNTVGNTVAGYADLAQVTVPVDNMGVSIGADAFGVNADFDGFTLGVMSETQTFLGNYANNMLVDVDGATTMYAGYTAETVRGNTTFYGGATLGFTTLDVNSNAMMKSADTLVSNSANIGVRQNFGAGTLTLSAELPVAIVSGAGNFEVASGVSATGDIQTASISSSLANTAREMNFGIGYDYALTESAMISTNANFTDNAGSIRGEESTVLGVSFKMTF